MGTVCAAESCHNAEVAERERERGGRVAFRQGTQGALLSVCRHVVLWGLLQVFLLAQCVYGAVCTPFCLGVVPVAGI